MPEVGEAYTAPQRSVPSLDGPGTERKRMVPGAVSEWQPRDDRHA